MKILFALSVLLSSISAFAEESPLLKWAKERAYSQPYAAMEKNIRPGFKLPLGLIEELKTLAKEDPRKDFEFVLNTPDGEVVIPYQGVENYITQVVEVAERTELRMRAFDRARGKSTVISQKESRNQRMAALSAVITRGLKKDEIGILYMGQQHAYELYAFDPSLPVSYVTARAFKDGVLGNENLRYVRTTLKESLMKMYIRDLYPALASNEESEMDRIELQGMAYGLGYFYYYNPTLLPKNLDLTGKKITTEPKAFAVGVAHATRDRSMLDALPSVEVLEAAGKKRVVILIEDLNFRAGKEYSDVELAKWYLDSQCKPNSEFIRIKLDQYRNKKHPRQQELMLTEAQIKQLEAIATADSACFAVDFDALIKKFQGYRAAGLTVVFNGLELVDGDPLIKYTDYLSQIYRTKTHFDATMLETGKPPKNITEAQLTDRLKELDEKVYSKIRAY